MDKLAMNRRHFIKGAGALTVGLWAAPNATLAGTDKHVVFAPNAFVRIEANEVIRVVMPHAEMGQGVYTGLAQVLADELDADWRHVVAEHLTSLDTDYNHQTWGIIATGASTSVTTQWDSFRRAGATARAMLVQAAAEQWGVPAASLTTSNSTVVDRANGREIGYGALTARAAELPAPEEVTLKRPEQYTIIGRNLQRVDSVSKSSGEATFGMDLRLPDMLYAAIAHCPVFGGKVGTYDATAANAMPGVRKVVEIPTGVAVIAESFWQAKTAKDALEIDWDEGAFASVSSTDLWREYAALADKKGSVFERGGTVDFSKTKAQIEGEMRFPFLAHAPMEPLNATAQVKGARCEIWSGTQFQGLDADLLEQLLGFKRENIRINTLWLGGSFGRRGVPNSDFVIEAAQIAKASGLENPIKMVWQREDDIQGGFYRPMALHRFRVGIDDSGMPSHWDHRLVAASITKGTSFEEAYYEDGFDLLSIDGMKHHNYHVPNYEYCLHDTKHAVSVCWLRGEAELHTGPALESIMNRLARLAGHDPIDYRRKLLKDTAYGKRMRGILDTLETASNWKQPVPENVFRGVAVMPCFGSVCGYVVDLKKTGKTLQFHRVTAAIDCGRAINPDGVRSQVQGAAAFALSMVMGQRITIDAGRPVQSNFHDYTVAESRHVPDVEVHLVDNGLAHPTGVGEVGVPAFIPAVMEAITAATGVEVNEFPMKLEGFTFLDT
jgi:isoquinoline 1-oxidoreductase beta subunit